MRKNANQSVKYAIPKQWRVEIVRAVGPAAADVDGQPVPIPACTTDEALTVNDGHVRCTLRTNLTDLVTLRANVVALSEILANTSRALAEIGPPILKRSTYMGSSFMIGRARAVSFQTGALGITAVSEICEAAFGPSAHLCTPYELHRSASLGLLAGVGAAVPAGDPPLTAAVTAPGGGTGSR